VSPHVLPKITPSAAGVIVVFGVIIPL